MTGNFLNERAKVLMSDGLRPGGEYRAAQQTQIACQALRPAMRRSPYAEAPDKYATARGGQERGQPRTSVRIATAPLALTSAR
ncbi:hypothetical protein J2X92_002745 [Variovorax paradoxus]|jgi:hypothetical protein|nr:hypothetical protein [Variovorax paradoxus]